MSPYVGMARKQEDGSNGCISNYTIITLLGAGFTHFKAPYLLFSNTTLANKDVYIGRKHRKVANR